MQVAYKEMGIVLFDHVALKPFAKGAVWHLYPTKYLAFVACVEVVELVPFSFQNRDAL